MCRFIVSTRRLSKAIIRLRLHEELRDSMHLYMKYWSIIAPYQLKMDSLKIRLESREWSFSWKQKWDWISSNTPCSWWWWQLITNTVVKFTGCRVRPGIDIPISVHSSPMQPFGQYFENNRTAEKNIAWLFRVSTIRRLIIEYQLHLEKHSFLTDPELDDVMWVWILLLSYLEFQCYTPVKLIYIGFGKIYRWSWMLFPRAHKVVWFNNKQQQQSLFLLNLHFNILTSPRIASASLGGPVNQDLMKYLHK